MLIRKIFQVARASQMMKTVHLNSRGANQKTKEDIEKLFEKTESKVLRNIIDKYYADFKVCGYVETLELLKNILKKKHKQ